MSASSFFVEGPAYTWVGLGSAKAFLFLGFTEAGLTVSINPYNEPINVDYGGPSLPGDVSQFGFDMNFSGTYTRYDPVVAQQIASMSGNFVGQQAVGSFANNQMGSLLNLENVGYPLLVYFPYTAKTQFNTEISGYNCGLAYLENPLTFVASIKRKAPEFNFKALPVFGTFNGSTFSPNTAPWNAFQVFTNSMPDPLPNVD
jgi:hypothetical protein